MTTSYPPATLSARRPSDLLAVVPFMLGFHPADSLVALLLHGGRVLLTARFDLGLGLEEAVAEVVDRHGPTGLVLVAYAADPEQGRAVLRAQAAGPDAVQVVDLLLVTQGRWWSLACTAGCCPAEGTPYAPEDHPLSAEAVWAGMVARPDREAVGAAVAGPAETELAALREAVRPLARRLDRCTPAGRQDVLGRAVVTALPRVEEARPSRDGVLLDDVECLRLALLVREVGARDVACALVTREDARRHVALWEQVVARTPPELAAGPLCLLGLAGWASGNGTLLNVCCERLGELDPAYPMGRLLSDVSRRGLPPAWWDAMADGLRRDLGLQGPAGRGPH